MKLKISDALSLPLSYATKTAAILAQRRKGKTYTASVIAEEMVAAKQPFVALDPTGAWWGLRASADGSSAGLPVVILGGQHGDVPLERTGGKVVADLVVDTPGFYVVDFSLFESGEAERQFAVDFAERLYRAKAQPGKNFPLHLFVDEADRFIPQNLSNKSETSPRLLGAFEAIVRRGGLRGLGTTLISQRAAIVNKNVLEMVDVLVVLRTIGPNDQKAIKAYVQAHGSEKELADIMGSLASLPTGEAWWWEPGADLFQRVQIRRRRTFNSSATPDAAERAVEPKQLAAVDLQALTVRMKDTIDRAKADDPKELRRRIAELEREAKKKAVEILPTSRNTQTGIKPPAEILTDADRALLQELREEWAAFSDTIGDKADAMLAGLAERAKAEIDKVFKTWSTGIDMRRELYAKRLESARVQKLFGKLEQLQAPPPRHTPHSAQVQRPPARTPLVNGSRSAPAVSGEETLTKGERTVLTAVAQYPDGLSREQLTTLTTYKRSTRDLYLQQLGRRGAVGLSGGRIVVTPEGMALLGEDFDPLPTGAALLQHWRNKLPQGELNVLNAVVSAYPRGLEREAVSQLSGYKRSTRDLYIQQLQRRQLVRTQDGLLLASEELFS